MAERGYYNACLPRAAAPAPHPHHPAPLAERCDAKKQPGMKKDLATPSRSSNVIFQALLKRGMQVSDITVATQRQLMCALTRITEAADAVDLTHEQLVTRELVRELAPQEQSGQCRLAWWAGGGVGYCLRKGRRVGAGEATTTAEMPFYHSSQSPTDWRKWDRAPDLNGVSKHSYGNQQDPVGFLGTKAFMCPPPILVCRKTGVPQHPNLP